MARSLDCEGVKVLLPLIEVATTAGASGHPWLNIAEQIALHLGGCPQCRQWFADRVGMALVDVEKRLEEEGGVEVKRVCA